MRPFFVIHIGVLLLPFTPLWGGDELAKEKTKEGTGGAESATVKKEKYGPRDIEVRLRDGTTVRGEIKDLDALTLKTSFGTLKFPVTDLVRVQMGRHVMGRDPKAIEKAIADLAGEDAAKRNSAQQFLEGCGTAALDPLFDARPKANGEARGRIDALLKTILIAGANGPGESKDTVRCTKFEAPGVLQLDSFSMKSRLGELHLKFEDVDGIRWLSRGSTATLKLEANSAINDWYDTCIDVSSGDAIAISVSGMINLFNNQTPPTGNTNWNSRPFPMGAVIARVGAGGDPVLIGNGRRMVADHSDHLFLKIFVSDEIKQRGDMTANGEFSVNVATGSWGDAAGSGGGIDPALPEPNEEADHEQ